MLEESLIHGLDRQPPKMIKSEFNDRRHPQIGPLYSCLFEGKVFESTNFLKISRVQAIHDREYSTPLQHPNLNVPGNRGFGRELEFQRRLQQIRLNQGGNQEENRAPGLIGPNFANNIDNQGQSEYKILEKSILPLAMTCYVRSSINTVLQESYTNVNLLILKENREIINLTLSEQQKGN